MFFLTAENRCSVEERAGHDAKPETCRLFPFNNILRPPTTWSGAAREALSPPGRPGEPAKRIVEPLRADRGNGLARPRQRHHVGRDRIVCRPRD